MRISKICYKNAEFQKIRFQNNKFREFALKIPISKIRYKNIEFGEFTLNLENFL